MKEQINPSHIMQVGMGFWASKTLLVAVKLELFTKLGANAFTGEKLGAQLGLHERGIWDFFDALVSLGFLNREGEGKEALYGNTEETALFLVKNSQQYIGGILEMCNDRLYKYWGDLEEGLKTGNPQNEIKHTGRNFFEEIYDSPESLKQFVNASIKGSKEKLVSVIENIILNQPVPVGTGLPGLSVKIIGPLTKKEEDKKTAKSEIIEKVNK